MILRSATVDSNLFSGYFGNCPVITAEGRMHPVTTYFLEDIYESTGYRLASDSPAAIRYEASSGKKVSRNMLPIQGNNEVFLSNIYFCKPGFSNYY